MSTQAILPGLGALPLDQAAALSKQIQAANAPSDILPGLGALPPDQQKQMSDQIKAGDPGKGITEQIKDGLLAGVMGGIGDTLLRGVFVIGGLALVIVGFTQFRAVQTVVVSGARVARKAAEVTA